MLKIKDDVDLKELEKFGFYKSGGVYQKNLEVDMDGIIQWVDICIYIQESNRVIRFSAHEAKETTKIDVLYDLIQAGLVEKVDDK